MLILQLVTYPCTYSCGSMVLDTWKVQPQINIFTPYAIVTGIVDGLSVVLQSPGGVMLVVENSASNYMLQYIL